MALALGGLLTSCEVPTTFWVDATVDARDATVGDGSCASAAGDCTLRAAIQEANALDGPIRIELGDAETYTLAIAGTGEDLAATGDLDLTGVITIAGHGSTIDADATDRVLELIGSADIDLVDLTITGGHAQLGGGIRINGGTTAEVTRSTITANIADGFMRCQVPYLPAYTQCSSEAGGLPIISTTPYGNEGGGAGIWNKGTLSIWDSTISENNIPEIPPLTNNTECWIFVRSQVCDLHMGAGLLNYATANLVNVTISGNTIVDGFGAAIAEGPFAPPDVWAPITPQTTILFTTITGNVSTSPGVPIAASYPVPGWPSGGSAVVGSPRLGSTVIDGAGPLCSTSLAAASLGSNTATDGSCFDPAVQPTDRNDLPSGLGGLADNGGPTRTHLPLAGSPLIDSIPQCILPVDQRGFARLVGGLCSVGAVEP